jgi:ABC-2 type transport system ATP-binding protein
METDAVTVSDLVVRRGGKVVLRSLSCSIAPGSITGLIGPSGSGKTTLMRAIVGVQRVEAGTVTVFGEAAGSESLRQRVGYVTQSPSVYRDISVLANVTYFGALYGKGDDEARRAIDAVGLTDQTRQLTGSLSGGQFSRVSLACALVAEPSLLILDEPTVGLDPVLRAELWRYFASLVETGITLLVSSHVMDEAARCDSILLLREGSLIGSLTPDELRARGGSPDLDQAFLHLIEDLEVAA